MEDAFVNLVQSTGNLNFFASGANSINVNLDTFISGGFAIDPILNLNTSGSLVPMSGLDLYTSGAFPAHGFFNLYNISSSTLDTSYNPSGMALNIRPVCIRCIGIQRKRDFGFKRCSV